VSANPASVAVTPRGRRRRERLLDATASLVARHGFHAVGIADIGAAAGVSGSAIYRHFASKQEILVALLDTVVDGLLAGASAIVREHDDAESRLDALVQAHIEFALRDRAIITVYSQEINHLPDADRRRIRRTQREYADVWTAVVAEGRADLSPDSARAAVHAVFGMLNAVADYTTALPDEELARQLLVMARASLRAPAA
jgi:AcrR family transcriptional regulator